MKDEIIEHIISILEKEISINKTDSIMIDYIIIKYYYSYYKHSKKVKRKTKELFVNFLKTYNYKQNSVSAFYGNTMILYLIDAFNERNELLEYKERIENYVTYYALQLIRIDNIKHIDLSHEAYDLINGLVGILLYFTNSKDLKKYEFFIYELVNWFYSRLKQDEKNIKGFLIKNKYILDTKTKDFIGKGCGYIDMGLSHGIIAIAVALSKVYKFGKIERDKCYESINIILDFYKKHIKTTNSGLFPEIIAIDKNCLIPHYELKVSWCYGSLGILRGMYIISNNINDIELKNEVLFLLERLYSINIDFYMLRCPTFCHGYSGLFYISHLFNKDLDNILFEEKKEKALQRIWRMGDSNNIYYFYTKDTYCLSGYEQINNTNILDGIASILVPYFIVYSKEMIKNDFFSKLLAIA